MGLCLKKSLRKITEVQNYKRVRAIREKYTEKIALKFIRDIHALIMDTLDETPGEFRRHDRIRISGCDRMSRF